MRAAVLDGAIAVQNLRVREAAICGGERARTEDIDRYVADTTKVYRKKGSDELIKTRLELPDTWADMIKRSAEPGMQHQLVSHQRAQDHHAVVHWAAADPAEQAEFRALLAEYEAPGASAVIAAVPSAPELTTARGATALELRRRATLPGFVGAPEGTPGAQPAHRMVERLPSGARTRTG